MLAIVSVWMKFGSILYKAQRLGEDNFPQWNMMVLGKKHFAKRLLPRETNLHYG